jgi:hypothetical protein
MDGLVATIHVAATPFIVVKATVGGHRGTYLLFVSSSRSRTSIGVRTTAQKQRFGMAARTADEFDLAIAAPGANRCRAGGDLVVRPVTVPLIEPKIVARAPTHAKIAAPLGFGDTFWTRRFGTVAVVAEHGERGDADAITLGSAASETTPTLSDYP